MLGLQDLTRTSHVGNIPVAASSIQVPFYLPQGHVTLPAVRLTGHNAQYRFNAYFFAQAVVPPYGQEITGHFSQTDLVTGIKSAGCFLLDNPPLLEQRSVTQRDNVLFFRKVTVGNSERDERIQFILLSPLFDQEPLPFYRAPPPSPFREDPPQT